MDKDLLVYFRRRKKLSQKKFGELLGFAEQKINHLETGRADWKLEEIKRMFEVLELKKQEKLDLLNDLLK